MDIRKENRAAASRFSLRVSPPLIVGACANFECQVTAAVQTGSHTLFVGKIVASHMDAQAGDRLFATSDGQFAGFAKS